MQTEVQRKRIHTRKISYECYLRSDDLWDIEGSLIDTKDYPFEIYGVSVRKGEPMHDIRVRLTVDESYTVRAIEAEMNSIPFGTCRDAMDPLQEFVGEKLGPGWGRVIENRLGLTKGCTHIRNLLLNAATASYQAIDAHLRVTNLSKQRPNNFVDKCLSWRSDGPNVKLYLSKNVVISSK